MDHTKGISGHDSKEIIRLTEFQLDALREVATIGMGHATKSLSEMINRKIDIEMSKIELIPVGQIASRLKQKKHTRNRYIPEIERGPKGYKSAILFQRECIIIGRHIK